MADTMQITREQASLILELIALVHQYGFPADDDLELRDQILATFRDVEGQ